MTIRYALLIFVIGYAVIFTLRASGVVTENFVDASFYAGGLNLVNILAAYLLFDKSFGKTNKTFLIYNLGGMGLRLFFLLISIFLLLYFLNLDVYGFIFVFFVFYFLFLFLEVRFFVKKIDENKETT